MTDEGSSAGSSQRGRANDVARLSGRHLTFGWWALLWFVLLGLVLEALHGFKAGWYLEPAGTTRRLAWTLAHAHGTLLALVNLILGATMHRYPSWSPRMRNLASRFLLIATVVLPGGFFVGGLFPHEGDPGIGIFLVPIGGGLLALSVLLAALGARDSGRKRPAGG